MATQSSECMRPHRRLDGPTHIKGWEGPLVVGDLDLPLGSPRTEPSLLFKRYITQPMSVQKRRTAWAG